MARSRYDWTERRIKRFFEEGRGSGRGQSYKPWLTTSDVPSLGRTHRIFLARTSRQHHLLSDLEYYAFLNSSFDDDVVDIREQFPLDRAETLAIAAALGIKHPQDKGVSIVMTTDLLETRIAAEGHSETAIAIKPAEKLTETRTIEKLEIERIYWSRRKVPWFKHTIVLEPKRVSAMSSLTRFSQAKAHTAARMSQLGRACAFSWRIDCGPSAWSAAPIFNLSLTDTLKPLSDQTVRAFENNGSRFTSSASRSSKRKP
jgi:hypothetical protein